MVTETTSAQPVEPTADKQVLSSTFKSDVGLAATTTYGVPALPTNTTNTEDTTPVLMQDIRTTSPAPTKADLTTPNADLTKVQNPALPSAWEAVEVSAFPTGRDWWNSYTDSKRFERDPLFPTQKFAEDWFKENGQGSAKENQYLNGAVRYEDFKYRTERIMQWREDAKITNARPYISAAAGIVDIDIFAAAIPPVYGAAKVTQGAKLAARVVQGAAAGTGAALTNSALAPYSQRTEDERDMDTVVFGLVGVLSDVQRTQRAVQPSTGTGAPALPPHVQSSLNQATQQTISTMLPVSRPTATPSEIFKKFPVLSKMTASADELWVYTNGDQSTVVNKLLSNVHTEGDNVASAQASYLNNYGYLLASVEHALSDAIPAVTGVSSTPWTRLSGKYGQSTQEVMDVFQDSMQKLDQAVLDYADKNAGVVLSDDAIKTMIDSMNIHDAVKHAMKTYVDSGFATKIYDDAKANKFFEANGLDEIVRRPTYMPLQHNYDRMHNLVREGKATWDDIYEFYGQQITKIYPELLQPNFAKAGRTYQQVIKGAATATTAPFKLTVKQVGEHFVYTQRQAARGLSDVTTHGMGKETMHDMLTRAGLSSDDAADAVTEIFKAQVQKQSNPKNFRVRMPWDWNFKYTSPTTGEVLDLGKLTGGNVYGNLEAYSRRMAHLNGLAQYGLTQQSLTELLESYIDKAPRGINPQQVRAFMANVSDDLSGRPTGGSVSQAIRSAQAIADPMLLANSGLFGLVDLATQVVRTGVIRSFPHIYRGLRASLKGMKGMTKEQAKDLEDIFTGKLMQGSRWKNFMTHYSDNFAIEGGGVHEAAQYYGQSARFMNLSESVKRIQIGILMGTYIRALRGSAQGVAKHTNFLRDKLRMPDELIDGIHKEWAKHGEKIDDWDAAVRVSMEQKIFHEADNLAYTIQKGETPAILEYDAVGKVVLPYMRFAFAMQQKVLRRVWNRDGAAGLSILLAAQIPIAMMVAAAINVRKGEEPDKDLALGTLRAVTAIGILGYPIELLMNGVGANGVTALTPFSKTYNLIGDAFQGELTPRSIKENTVLNAAAPLDPFILALED